MKILDGIFCYSEIDAKSVLQCTEFTVYNIIIFQALGNHEFEDNIEGLVPYIKALQHPVLVSNMDTSKEPLMQGITQKSIVIERHGKKIGIIGVLVSTVGVNFLIKNNLN